MFPFDPGPTLVVGVNGSGKTTLISICLRCLTGWYDLPAATSESELGQIRPRAVMMQRYTRQMFARRVADGAKEAVAAITLRIGTRRIEIKRKLSDLALVQLVIDGITIDCKSEKGSDLEGEPAFQQKLADCFGVGAFFDVLIILRFLVFMLEDRRALVWDPTAQRQIFRVLTLPPARAGEYAAAQQELISADSAVRNTNALISRHQTHQKAAAKRAKTIAAAEVERRSKTAEAEAIRAKLEVAAKDRIEADRDRRSARLDRLKAAESRESSLRELERLKMESLKHWLEPSQDTLRYILGHLLAENRCLVCNTDPSPSAELINKRLKKGQCPVCGSNHQVDEGIVALTDIDRKRIGRLEQELELADQQIHDSDARIRAAQERFQEAESQFDALQQRRVGLDRELVDVLRKMPAEGAAVASASDEVEALRRILAADQRSRKIAEDRFRTVVAESVANVQALQHAIAEAFKVYLQLFLKEDASLVYQTTKAQVGQSGASFEFPAFRLSMTGGAVAGQTIRERPDAVSQSQAEFVDLAFRMALISVVAKGGPATMVVDAPEASLDFLFAERAGKQLASFSNAHPENRVIITSYLPSEHLVLAFLAGVRGIKQRNRRIVDLISLAAENAALRADRGQYEAFLNRVRRNERRTNV